MRPRPKFASGEKVILNSQAHPEMSGKCEVLRLGSYCAYTGSDGSNHPAEWGYILSIGGVVGFDFHEWAESTLRKLPPEDRISWENTEWQPNKIEA